MRKFAIVAALAVLGAGLIYADHTYESVADVHDIMEIVQKPSMDQLAAIMKAGGPQSDDDWKHSKAFASILSETTQLLLMGGREKDDAWTGGAASVIDGAKAAMAASDAKDLAAWKNGVGQMGKGCRTCHKVHKPPEEKK
jgi:cytochrome c556